jgi:hypothetical protein
MYIYETEIHEAITTNTVVISSHNKPKTHNQWQLYVAVITPVDGNSFVKIGISYNPARRFQNTKANNQLKQCHVLFLDIYVLPNVKSRLEAEKYEKYVQRYFIAEHINTPFEFDGKTECYNLDVTQHRSFIRERIYERNRMFANPEHTLRSIEEIKHQSI